MVNIVATSLKRIALFFNLDSGEQLPLKENSFDLVLCTDVLEHLENIHFVFDELCRISNRYIMISLPNPHSYLGIYSVLRGRKYSTTLVKQKEFGKYIKFYGLPLSKPRDRHRWFFNTEEAVDFVNYRAKKNNYKIENIVYTIDFQKRPKAILKRILFAFNRKVFLNLFNHTTWFLLKKNEK